MEPLLSMAQIMETSLSLQYMAIYSAAVPLHCILVSGYVLVSWISDNKPFLPIHKAFVKCTSQHTVPTFSSSFQVEVLLTSRLTPLAVAPCSFSSCSAMPRKDSSGVLLVFLLRCLSWSVKCSVRVLVTSSTLDAQKTCSQ